ncbi:MAG: four helix bundle protein [Muribaculaceae bacterium]|nr:four helix bundle protein [Muribaculaceae bacterium]
MNNNIVKEKSELFAIRIVNLYRHLSVGKKENVLSKQILRSGTSIGANLAEAECAISKNDFLSKMYIALKESSETQYWLKLLKNTDYITEAEFNSLFSDCNEITKILVKSIKTIKSQ